MYRTEFEANLGGFSCVKSNVMARQKQEVQFPLLKVASYALAVLVVLAVAKPVIF